MEEEEEEEEEDEDFTSPRKGKRKSKSEGGYLSVGSLSMWLWGLPTLTILLRFRRRQDWCRVPGKDTQENQAGALQPYGPAERPHQGGPEQYQAVD